ncbi:hypothetical protein [Gilvimarinus polysaccharolyticus]|uniref:hypothetical protein n=1 Tax=Gilvimarinus polysaccharolyticus TaxID=863921 RepID=UPI0006733775|nr:hypothetical protein [Gilvimarinus polysaccharolyticus]
MAFEQTTPNNPYNITKRQHFHMQAILRKFSINNQIKITLRSGGESRLSDASDHCFIGRRAWSEECESNNCHPIERKFLAQVRRVENSECICDHKAISEYHFLWYLRYHFSQNEVEDYSLYDNFPCGSFDKAVEELIESEGRAPVRSGGKIAGRFKATLNIKQLLEENDSLYEGYKWQVVKSTGNNFISSDCYGEKLMMAITPKIILIGSKNIKEPVCMVSDEEVRELNEKTMEFSSEFYFEAP